MKNLTLTQKLMILIVLPLTGVMIFGVRGALEKHAIAQKYKQLETSSSLLSGIGDLIHELQKERGRSAGYIASKGARFGNELNSQYAETDREAENVHELLSGFDAAGFGDEFETRLEKSIESVEQRAEKRSAIHAFDMAGGESAAYYSKTIAQLMDVISGISHHVPHTEIANGMSCYTNLVQVKEFTGQERALLSGVFSLDRFEGNMFARFNQMKAKQAVYLHLFESYASTEQRNFFKETVTGPSVEKVEAMRMTAEEKAAIGGFGKNADEWFDAMTQMIDLMKTVEDQLAADYKDKAQRIQGRASLTYSIYSICTLAILSLTIVAGFWAVRSIAGPLRKMIAELNAVAEQTATAAFQVSSASQMLAEGTSEQAASIEETSASLEEMNSMTQHNAESSRKSKDLAQETRESADHGVADMQAMNEAMDAIKQAGDDVAQIMRTIDEIAFQTNLLALNAAVEAARAGDAGKGFAVVAEEVRSLAHRSAQAAKETAGKIDSSIDKTNQGVKLSAKVSEVLNEIVTKARHLDELASEVAVASQEQTQGISQITVAVNEMDKVTQSNVANAEESAAAADQLNEQTDLVKKSAMQLVRLVDGSAT